MKRDLQRDLFMKIHKLINTQINHTLQVKASADTINVKRETHMGKETYKRNLYMKRDV